MLKHLFLSSRPLSWVNTAYPFGAAYLLMGGGLSLDFWLGCLFFLVPYNLAMYGINDVFDYESDMRNPRKGGVEGSVLDPALHRPTLLAAVFSCLPFVLYFLVTAPWMAKAMLVFSLFAVVAYSARGLRFKEIPVLDSVTSSLHFSTPAWFAVTLLAGGAGGGSAGAGADGAASGVLGSGVSTAGVLGLIAFFLWGMASQAFGAVQDIGPDREAGLKSIATAFGARGTVAVAVALYAAAAVLMGLTPFPLDIMAVVGLAYTANAVRFLNIDDASAERTRSGWQVFLWLNYAAGFVLTMILLAGALL
ncbi:prenyltransferase [Brevibacterium sp. HMSC08F02]|uniref:prenyltransferase n=1 Tax=Brevibacterium sp. HMSC08F02 TaxID=1581140 RepID=UPI0008A623F2|nr:prenyltransferase [Brevibacterium sp. HMSC08F02]OFT25926.1 prenyltransferase [Brevibacterium sp. HMSC08F02]